MHTKKWLWLRSKHAQIFKTHEEKYTCRTILLLKHGKKYYMPVLRRQGRAKYPTEEMPNVRKNGRKPRGGKVTGWRETGGKATGTKDNQERGGKGDMLMSEKEMDNMLPSDMTAVQNMMEGNRRKSYSDVVIESVTRKARVFMGDSIVRKTDKALYKGGEMVVCFPGTQIKDITERDWRKWRKSGVQAREGLFYYT